MLEVPIINTPKANEKDYKGKNKLKISNKVCNKKLKISLFEAHWLKLKEKNINKLKSEMVVVGVTEKYERSLGDPKDYHKTTYICVTRATVVELYKSAR